MSILTCSPTIDSYGNELSYLKSAFPFSGVPIEELVAIGSNE